MGPYLRTDVLGYPHKSLQKNKANFICLYEMSTRTQSEEKSMVITVTMQQKIAELNVMKHSLNYFSLTILLSFKIDHFVLCTT